jgi:hypothetical protein
VLLVTVLCPLPCVFLEYFCSVLEQVVVGTRFQHLIPLDAGTLSYAYKPGVAREYLPHIGYAVGGAELFLFCQ